MSETANFALPLVAGGQAQKHVTVNEALARLDALGQLVVQGDTVTTPPVGAAEGLVWHVPAGAVNDWAAGVGKLAISVNGGWDFVDPGMGWRAWHAGKAAPVVFDGAGWRQLPTAESALGAATAVSVHEFEHDFVAGGAHSTSDVIPEMAIVLGVTCRVSVAETGSLTSWKLGVAGADDRYGSGYGVSENSWGRGITGSPVAYYADTPLLLTPTGGTFDGVGKIRFAVHMIFLNVPKPV